MSKVDGDLIQSILWYAIAAIWALSGSWRCAVPMRWSIDRATGAA